MKRPIFLVLISFIFGILFFTFLRSENEIKFLVFLVCSFFIFFSFYFRMDKKFKIFTLMFFVGFFIMSLQKTEGNFYFNENVNLKGEVVSVKLSENFKNYVVEIFEKDGEFFREKTLLSANSDFEIGDVLSFSGKIKEIKENTNPKLFNYKRYYSKSNIFSKIFSNDVKVIGRSRNIFLNAKYNFQNFVEKTFDSTLSEENSNILKRIFLGNKYDFDFEEDARQIGISHILAISGLHIGIIYFILIFIFKFFPISKLLREILVIFLICLYSNLIGNPSSVIRAIVYISVVKCTKFTGMIVDNLNSLLLSLFLILLYSPILIFDIGLQLSFLSVLSIILIAPKILNKRDNLINSSFKLTFSILILTAPVIFTAFGEISILSFIGNLILIPFFVIAIVLGFVILIFGLIHFKLSLILGFFVDLLLDLIRLNVEILNKINLKISYFSFGIFHAILFYILVFSFFSGIIIKIKEKEFRFFAISFLILTIFANIYHYNKNLVKINFIDIGQGDSILIRGNKNNILVDTGGLVYKNGNNGKTTLLPYLKKQGVKKLDYVFISHLDKDHCGNLKFLSENMTIENLILRRNGYKDYVKLYGNLNIKNIFEIENTDILELPEMNFEIFQTQNGFEENEKSIILNLYVNGKRILFTGDIGFFTENQLLKNNIECDYLKVAHHGSKNSSSIDFLKKANAKVAIISCGENNNYGHPHKNTVERLENANMKIFRTDKGGNIILEIDKFSDKIVPYKKIKGNIIELIKFYREDITFNILFLIAFFVLFFEYEKFKNLEKIEFDL